MANDDDHEAAYVRREQRLRSAVSSRGYQLQKNCYRIVEPTSNLVVAGEDTFMMNLDEVEAWVNNFDSDHEPD